MADVVVRTELLPCSGLQDGGCLTGKLPKVPLSSPHGRSLKSQKACPSTCVVLQVLHLTSFASLQLLQPRDTENGESVMLQAEYTVCNAGDVTIEEPSAMSDIRGGLFCDEPVRSHMPHLPQGHADMDLCCALDTQIKSVIVPAKG